jgi:hypothetical protein
MVVRLWITSSKKVEKSTQTTIIIMIITLYTINDLIIIIMISNLPQFFREPYSMFPSFPGVPKHKFLIISCSKCNPHPPSKHATIAMRHDKLVLPNRTFQA